MGIFKPTMNEDTLTASLEQVLQAKTPRKKEPKQKTKKPCFKRHEAGTSGRLRKKARADFER
jgi:hypothetical protein